MSFSNYTEPCARKTHRCEFCGFPIVLGSKYSRLTGKYEDDMYSIAAHRGCYWVITTEYDLSDRRSDEGLSSNVCEAFTNTDLFLGKKPIREFFEHGWRGWKLLDAQERFRVKTLMREYMCRPSQEPILIKSYDVAYEKLKQGIELT